MCQKLLVFPTLAVPELFSICHKSSDLAAAAHKCHNTEVIQTRFGVGGGVGVGGPSYF